MLRGNIIFTMVLFKKIFKTCFYIFQLLQTFLIFVFFTYNFVLTILKKKVVRNFYHIHDLN